MLLASCAKEPSGLQLLAEVRQALANRDARLTGFHFDATSTSGAQTLTHSFDFRSPNQMRVVLPNVERSFDGTSLYEASAGKVTRYALKLSPAKASMFLHETFAPYVPEGFRTPLMPMKGVTATKNADTVELAVAAGSVVYRLRWPGADFLSKRTGNTTLTVDEEHCEKNFCVPKKLTESIDGVPVVATSLTNIVLAPQRDAFVPEGVVRESREVVEE